MFKNVFGKYDTLFEIVQRMNAEQMITDEMFREILKPESPEEVLTEINNILVPVKMMARVDKDQMGYEVIAWA